MGMKINNPGNGNGSGNCCVGTGGNGNQKPIPEHSDSRRTISRT